MKKLLITQSNYIPWKGYFDSIHLVDEVILYDDAQYTKRDWRNRNKIKSVSGPAWLSIPVDVKGKFLQRIRDTRISDKGWNEKHWKTIAATYSKASYFKQIKEFTEPLFRSASMDFLSEVNYWFLTEISRHMGISTPIRFSDSFDLREMNPTEKLVYMCQKTGASKYFTGPSAKAYLEEEKFHQANIEVCYLNFEGYPEYPQMYPPFSHYVTILDLLFNTGTDFRKYMKTFPYES